MWVFGSFHIMCRAEYFTVCLHQVCTQLYSNTYMCDSSCENDKLLPPPMQSGLLTIFNQHIVPYTVNKSASLTQMSSLRVNARSSRVNILTLSIRQHTFHLLPYGMWRAGCHPHTNIPANPPHPTKLYVCVHSKLCLAFDLSRRMVLLPAALLPTPTYRV